MAENWYLLPAVECLRGGETIPNSKCPKYLTGTSNQRSNMGYGRVDLFLSVVKDIDPITKAIIEAAPDVWVAPADLETTLGGPGSNALESFVEPFGLPGNFLKPSDTHREALRRFSGMFQFVQAMSREHNHDDPFTVPGFGLNVQWSNIPADWQAAMVAAAESFGYPTTSMTGNNQLRAILLDMADAWGVTPFLFGFTTL